MAYDELSIGMPRGGRRKYVPEAFPRLTDRLPALNSDATQNAIDAGLSAMGLPLVSAARKARRGKQRAAIQAQDTAAMAPQMKPLRDLSNPPPLSTPTTMAAPTLPPLAPAEVPVSAPAMTATPVVAPSPAMAFVGPLPDPRQTLQLRMQATPSGVQRRVVTLPGANTADTLDLRSGEASVDIPALGLPTLGYGAPPDQANANIAAVAGRPSWMLDSTQAVKSARTLALEKAAESDPSRQDWFNAELAANRLGMTGNKRRAFIETTVAQRDQQRKQDAAIAAQNAQAMALKTKEGETALALGRQAGETAVSVEAAKAKEAEKIRQEITERQIALQKLENEGKAKIVEVTGQDSAGNPVKYKLPEETAIRMGIVPSGTAQAGGGVDAAGARANLAQALAVFNSDPTDDNWAKVVLARHAHAVAQQPLAAQPSPVSEPTATGPNGAKLVFRNGQWVPAS